MFVPAQVEPDITKDDSTGRGAKTLSGGEKSFSQICLLLALWEAMGSPIRCLDELYVTLHPVFMLSAFLLTNAPVTCTWTISIAGWPLTCL